MAAEKAVTKRGMIRVFVSAEEEGEVVVDIPRLKAEDIAFRFPELEILPGPPERFTAEEYGLPNLFLHYYVIYRYPVAVVS